MANVFVFFSLLVCCLSVFLVIDVEHIRPYQDAVKSYAPDYVKQVIDSGVSFIRTRILKLKPSDSTIDRVFSKEELTRFTGEGGGDIYLAILGKVYDVTRGKRHYGPDGGYHGFAGRDGTRAFITGEFNDEGLVENIDGLKLPDILGLDGWQQFYEKDYKYVGKLEGDFYDKDGKPRGSLRKFQSLLNAAKEKQKVSQAESRRFPPCNSEWKQETGTRLWCSNKSGGVDRDWVGLPREFHEPGRRVMRCACVRDTGPPSDDPQQIDHKNRGDLDNPRFKIYPGCDLRAVSCYIKT